jgi:deazaflavin-dependent oxidoreductase (nitroreductase family)
VGLMPIDKSHQEPTSAPPTRVRRLRPFATRFVNPVTRPLVAWLPGFALLTYPGRKSGRVYHTPINVFRRGDDFIFFLTYGSNVQWVQNVLAAGGCEMRRMGKDYRLGDPELIYDPKLRLVPLLIRWVGRLWRVTEMLRMRRLDDGPSAQPRD